MLKKKLLTLKKSQESKKIKFVSKTASALLIVFLFAAVFLIAPLVLAQNDTFGLEPLAASGLPTVSLGVVVARIINAALGLLGLVAVIILLYGGFLWMTSKGEAEKVQKAKKLLIQGLIGLIIIVLSFAIAQFIFLMLGINPWGPDNTGNGVIGGDQGGGGGALGAGIIRIHYPARNAKNVPRNTKISITFREGICVTGDNSGENSFINVNNVQDLGDDVTKGTMIKIYPKPAAGATPNYIPQDQIKVYNAPPTGNNKYHTFTFRPVEYLGNDQTPTWYTVELTTNIKKADCKTPVFGSFKGYKWSFEVSTELDLTPPQINSVIPHAYVDPKTFARNTVIQINFNEAIDPMTLAGKLQIVNNDITGQLIPNTYDLMTVKAGALFVGGEFYFSNHYRTVEFITNDPCGTNSCGNDIFCLPGAKEISVLVKAATTELGKPTAAFPYDGLVDMCSNSLDGNKNGTAQGPSLAGTFYSLNSATGTGDNAGWIFNTNNLIDLVPPQIDTRNPDINAPAFNPDNNPTLSFDKELLSSSVNQGASLILEGLGDLGDYDLNVDNSVITINTYGDLEDTKSYTITAKSGIKDITQNCFLPCADCPTGVDPALCNCKRAEPPVIPGKYLKGDPWKESYPTASPLLYPNCILTP